MRKSMLAAALVSLLTPSLVFAQTFNSGSTGADGALDLTSGDQTIQLPESGVLNYTTVNVPAGRTLMFRPNLHNTPVMLLAQGDVNIAGAVDVSATSGCIVAGYSSCGSFWSYMYQIPGPGGFRGGAVDQPAFGPGGGAPGNVGQWVGSLSLVPIIGGSGGGGGITPPIVYCGPVAGSGGGGAIAIASSGQIAVSGAVNAAGGGAAFYSGSCYFSSAGGSGGAIRLVANSIAVSGSLNASGGGGGWSVTAGAGVIRLEAPVGALSFTGGASPAAVLSTINPSVLSPSPASLSIISVGGYPVPSYSGQRFDTVDLLLPAQLQDPIAVAVTASNIPVGTPVGITFGTGNAGTVVLGTLAGTTESSTATVYVSGLNRNALAYLFVFANFSVPQTAANVNPSGANHVDQVRVVAAPGTAPRFLFLRVDGSTIDTTRLPAEFLSHFGK